ncbi:MAG TPA: hypothetical protein PKA82_16670 [Pyrinomonadaceae bacterium]|nr:hypothetical protein [Pyrinomonadaceae bacterium]
MNLLLTSALFIVASVNAQKEGNACNEINGSVTQLIGKLESNDAELASAGVRGLIVLASRSAGDREAVVSAVMKSVETADFLNGELTVIPPREFQLWRNANHVFRELLAFEAVDLVVGCMYCSDGVVKNQPGYRTLTVFGSSKFREQTVEKLSNVLKTGNKQSRSLTAVLFSEIGGSEAKTVLTTAYNSETDQEVKGWIRKSLDAIDRSPARN